MNTAVDYSNVVYARLKLPEVYLILSGASKAAVSLLNVGLSKHRCTTDKRGTVGNDDGLVQDRHPPRSILTVPNVIACPSMATAPIWNAHATARCPAEPPGLDRNGFTYRKG